jgi:hypothetical protein
MQRSERAATDSIEATEGRPRIGRGRAVALFGIGVSVHLLFLSSLATGFLDPLFDDTTHRLGRGADFYAVYQAGQNVIDGVSIYEWNRDTSIVPYWYPYRYAPPPALTLGRVATLVRPETAYLAWVAILEALLGMSLWLTWRWFPDRRRALIAMSLWLLFSPYYLEIYLGQFSFAMASLTFWALHWWSSGPRRFGDSAWIASLLLKSNSVLFAPALLKDRRWKPVAVGAVLLAATSIPYFLAAPGSFRIFSQNVTGGLSAASLPGNLGMAALVATSFLRLGGGWSASGPIRDGLEPGLVGPIELPLMLLTLLVGGATLFVTIRTSRRRFPELVLLWLLVHFLAYKHVWEHHYVMILPVFILLYRRMAEGSPVRISPSVFWGAFALIALPTPFVFLDIPSAPIDPEFQWTTAASLVYHVGKPVAVLAIYIALALAMLRAERQPVRMEGPAPSNARP